MNVFVILNSGLGASLGTNFTLSANVGGAPIPATATLQQLLDGINVQVNNFATQITITSTGVCTNSITLNIVPPTTTTTTSTTTSTTTTTTTTTTTNGFNFYNAEVYDCSIATNCSLPTSYAVVKFPLGITPTIGTYYSIDELLLVWYRIISPTSPDVTAITIWGTATSTIVCPCTPTTTTTTTTTSTTTTSTTTTSTTTTTTSTTTSVACVTYTNNSEINWTGEYQDCNGTWYYNQTIIPTGSICAKLGTPFTLSGIDLTSGVSCIS